MVIEIKIIMRAFLLLLMTYGARALLHGSTMASMDGRRTRARHPYALAKRDDSKLMRAAAGSENELFPDVEDGSSKLLIKDRRIDEYTDKTRTKKRMTTKPFESQPTQAKAVNRASKRAAAKAAKKKR